jgi:membrane protease YdiL (CAAX protease family)
MASTVPPRPGAAVWYVTVALGWTGGLGILAALLGERPGAVVHMVALLGPLVAWVSALWLYCDPAYRRGFLVSVIDIRWVSRAWWLAILAVGLGPALGGAAVLLLTRGQATWEPSLTAVGAMTAVGFALLAGLIEEPGWRGVAQDAAATRLGVTGSALVLGVLWSLWHLPLYFIDGTYQHGLGVGTPEFWLSMGTRVPLAVLLVWLVTGTRGLVVAAVLAHALGNTVGELIDTGTAGMVAELSLTVLAAAAVVGALARRRTDPAMTRVAADASHHTG